MCLDLVFERWQSFLFQIFYFLLLQWTAIAHLRHTSLSDTFGTQRGRNWIRHTRHPWGRCLGQRSSASLKGICQIHWDARLHSFRQQHALTAKAAETRNMCDAQTVKQLLKKAEHPHGALLTTEQGWSTAELLMGRKLSSDSWSPDAQSLSAVIILHARNLMS